MLEYCNNLRRFHGFIHAFMQVWYCDGVRRLRAYSNRQTGQTDTHEQRQDLQLYIR